MAYKLTIIYHRWLLYSIRWKYTGRKVLAVSLYVTDDAIVKLYVTKSFVKLR